MTSDGVVWSSDHGRMCAACGRAKSACACKTRDAAPDSATPGAVVRVERQTKGRRGRGVTAVTGLPLSQPDLARLAKELKRRCGSGGTVKDGVIEVQGDHRDTLVAELERRGYTVKRAGG